MLINVMRMTVMMAMTAEMILRMMTNSELQNVTDMADISV